MGQGNRPAGVAVLQIIPRQRWWFAHIYGSHEPELFSWPTGINPIEPGCRTVAIDVCRAPQFLDATWSYVDLELDLLGDGSGTVVVNDEDEFADGCAAKVISADEAARARATTTEMKTRLAARDEPFGWLAWDRLAAALELGLPPLVDLPRPS